MKHYIGDMLSTHRLTWSRTIILREKSDMAEMNKNPKATTLVCRFCVELVRRNQYNIIENRLFRQEMSSASSAAAPCVCI